MRLFYLAETFSQKGELLFKNQLVVFFVGAGNFGGPRQGNKIVPVQAKPSRAPDATLTQKTNIDQAALYRLNGKNNKVNNTDETN